MGGYAIGYDSFEGNIYEGHTLVPFLEKIALRLNLNKPIVVADAGLLSNENTKVLEEKQYQYITSARLKNEPQKKTINTDKTIVQWRSYNYLKSE